MSIILDALKKAQKKPAPTEAGAETQVTESPVDAAKALFAKMGTNPKKMSPPKRNILILAGICISLLAVALFGNMGEKMAPPLTDQQVQTIQPMPAPVLARKEDQKGLQEKKEAAQFFQTSKYLEANETYKKLTTILPSDPEVYNNYGLSLKKIGKVADAKQAYNTAIALEPEYPEALNNLAVIEISEGQYNEARHHLEHALRIRPDYLDAKIHLALCLEKIGEPQSALTHYQEYLKKSEGQVSRQIRVQIENRVAQLTHEAKK